jgi:fermentation-respiration switch protein FrsA (DUF1100 family)
MNMPIAFLAIVAFSMQISLANDQWPWPHEMPRQEAFPNPLVMLDGTPIATAHDWQARRKPELRRLFQRYMYGRLPATPKSITGKTLFEDRRAFGGRGILREVEVTFGPPEWPKIYLLIATPAGEGPFPCFVGANFPGNHQFTENANVRIPAAWMRSGYVGVVKNRASAAGRAGQVDVWPLEEIIARGYATATFYAGDVQPDRPSVREGMRATLPESDGPGNPTEPSTLMWWAWGIHRAIDHLAKDPAIDASRIAVVGHSRMGKAALLAGAFDERIAVVIPHQAGCGGSAPSRTDDPRAERLDKINTVRPHWFCDYFKCFSAEPSRLPFDQHCLVALCAPRPVLFTNAAEDHNANPPGQFAVLKAATCVYEMLGEEGLTAERMPAPGEPLIDSRLGYWIRAGEHAMTPADWTTYMDFADKWLK